MFIRRGNQTVGQGTFWNIVTGQRVDIEGRGVLPGDQRTRYLKMSSVLFLAMGPVIGLLYVITLPFIGIVTVGTLIIGKVMQGVFGLLGKSLSFGWRPRTAYLSGKKKQRTGKQ